MNALRSFAALSQQSIDLAAGIIRGVSVITEGPALGHGLRIDAQTLSTVHACATQFADGVRVKTDHGTGFEAIIGVLRDFRVDGAQLRADLHLIKSHPRFASIAEMAATMPGSFGLSISFSGQSQDKAARCQELYSVDLVDRPAANPWGLFSIPVDFKPTPEMSVELESKKGVIEGLKEFFGSELRANLESKTVELNALKAAHATELAAKEGRITELSAQLEAAQKSVTDLTAEIAQAKAAAAKQPEQVKELAAKEAQQIAAAVGIPPVELKAAETTPGGNKIANTWTAKCEQARASQ